jgi:hypothetical protein
MTNAEYDAGLYKFSYYHSRELSLVKELDEHKDLSKRVCNYNSNEDYRYMLKLITGVRRAWF